MKNRMLLGALAVTALVPFAFASRLEVQGAGWSEGLAVPGVAGRIHAFARWDDGTGPALYAGGLFEAAEDTRALNVARWRDGATAVTYCTGKTNSLGCVPFISSTGTPSATLSSPWRPSRASCP